jgi:dipeptidyl aminopeptidase/acylaminoacyl peptidase
MATIRPYGTWHSPITAEWLTLGQKKFGTIVLDGKTIYWDEMRPTENGRSVVVQCREDGKLSDVTPSNFSVRSRVHEYGGAPFTVHEEKVYFVNDKDQRIYLNNTPLTEPGTRFADLHVQFPYLIAVAEQGTKNYLACLHLETKQLTCLAEGSDFYASPTFSPQGDKLAFLTWDHPQMPWDGTTLWVAGFKEGVLSNLQKIAGGEEESIFQPAWSPKGDLHYISDKTGWWNLYSNDQPVAPQSAECGLPQWVFGMSTYAFADQKLLMTSFRSGSWSFLNLPWTYYSQIRACPDFAVFIAASPSQDKCIVKLDLATEKTTILAHNLHPHLDPCYLSIPQFLTFPSHGGRTSHAYFYAPTNKNYQPPPGTLPPLVVMTHGGPTAATNSAFDLKIQYWTTRGIAVLDVDYGGSSGYGRAYRDALKGTWGVVDVEDCEAAASFLIQQKKVDPKKIAIRGASAGGYTTLAALTFGSTFTVGASYYGIGDLTALAQETHKFESHYLDTLIGPYPAAKPLYEKRSPLFHVSKLHCPVIFFQGTEDLVVPPNQAEKMYEALQQRGIPSKLILYPGEQHGFRKAENIRDSLEKELAFFLNAWYPDSYTQ